MFFCFQELLSKLKNNLKAIDLIQKAADELLETIKDPAIEKNIQNEISHLKHEIEIELEAIMSRNAKLTDIKNIFEDFSSIFESYQEKVLSLQLYITQSIPSSFEETRKVLERVEVSFFKIKYFRYSLKLLLMLYWRIFLFI